jgi:hypothetical protein
MILGTKSALILAATGVAVIGLDLAVVLGGTPLVLDTARSDRAQVLVRAGRTAARGLAAAVATRAGDLAAGALVRALHGSNEICSAIARLTPRPRVHRVRVVECVVTSPAGCPACGSVPAARTAPTRPGEPDAPSRLWIRALATS